MTSAEILSAVLARRGDDALVVTDERLRIRDASAEAAALADRPVGRSAA